jgi:predicted PurR-regulated permease PerM
VVPVGGSALVWVPVSLYLFAAGEATHGLVVLGFGAVVVGVVDNVLRPLLGRSGLDLHPLLMFLAVFGGLAAFGASGLYLGPLCVALFVAVARIYERDLAPSLGGAAVNEDASVDREAGGEGDRA